MVRNEQNEYITQEAGPFHTSLLVQTQAFVHGEAATLLLKTEMEMLSFNHRPGGGGSLGAYCR